MTLCGLIKAGKITAAIDRRYPLTETAAAIAYLEEGHARAESCHHVSNRHWIGEFIGVLYRTDLSARKVLWHCFCRCYQLIELRCASQLRPYCIVLQTWVGAIVSGNCTLNHFHGQFFLPRRKERPLQPCNGVRGRDRRFSRPPLSVQGIPRQATTGFSMQTVINAKLMPPVDFSTISFACANFPSRMYCRMMFVWRPISTRRRAERNPSPLALFPELVERQRARAQHKVPRIQGTGQRHIRVPILPMAPP